MIFFTPAAMVLTHGIELTGLLYQDRFKIPKIGEFYASTEGNVIFVNRHNVRHSVGFAPAVFPFLHCGRIVRYNVDTDQVYSGHWAGDPG